VLGCGDDYDGEPADEATPAGAATTAPAASPTGAQSPAASATAAAPGVKGEDIEFAGPASDLVGYLARPDRAGPFPGVLVIHENRGLNEHIRDVARRFAGEGFLALAVDLVSRAGGSSADASANTAALSQADPDDLVVDLEAFIASLQEQPDVRAGGVAVTGFCFGGGYTWEILVRSDQVVAAAPFYGSVRAEVFPLLSETTAAVLAIYGELDTRITSQAELVRTELDKSAHPYEIKVYEGADHAFFNDTGARYNAEAAADAWETTLAWFREHMG
jgi:carboxymethylenebutenolidase